MVGSAAIAIEVKGKQIIKARHNVRGEATVIMEEERAAVDPLMAVEIQKVFNATITISLDTMHQIARANPRNEICNPILQKH